jgi:hypothetical protein
MPYGKVSFVTRLSPLQPGYTITVWADASVAAQARLIIVDHCILCMAAKKLAMISVGQVSFHHVLIFFWALPTLIYIDSDSLCMPKVGGYTSVKPHLLASARELLEDGEVRISPLVCGVDRRIDSLSVRHTPQS